MKCDVIIIGAGIIGACVARELSKTKARVILADRENDVSCGTSKANSGIVHAGYDPEPGTLMAKYNVEGAAMFEDLSRQLDFPFKKTGSLVLAFDDAGLEKIKVLYDRGLKNGARDLSLLSAGEVRELEPNVSENVKGALLAASAGIVSPYQATWAIAENAVMNGVEFLRETMVHSIKKNAAGEFELETSRGTITASYVVNAAGLYADKISEMAGARKFRIVKRHGEYCLLDSKCRNLVERVLFQTPGPLGKGVLVTQTVDGNILIGPSATDTTEAEFYTGTTASGQEKILRCAELSVPDIPRRNIINSFAGIRAIAFEQDSSGEWKNIDDFIIEEDASVKGFVNVAGICSPGLTSAPAIGIGVARILFDAGLSAAKNENFVAERHGIPSFKECSFEEKQELIKKDSRFGQIICRCEMITEGEIVASIKSPLGAVDLDGVKRRTRAGMGRCQSGFCSPRVTEIISRELSVPMTSVTKRGGSSFILDSKTRATVSDIAGGKHD